MLGVVVSGLATGFLISAPLGPMAALASLEVSRKRWKPALAVASGVCLGDSILAGIMLLMFRAPWSISIPEWMSHVGGALVLAVLGVVIWKDADKPVFPAASQSFSKAVAATLAHPGNIIGFAALYASTLQAWDGRNVAELDLVQNAILFATTLMGMMIGWGLVLGAVYGVVCRFGQIPAQWQSSVSRGVSGLMMVSALLLLVSLF